jgi:hypothetical protein
MQRRYDWPMGRVQTIVVCEALRHATTCQQAEVS